MKKIIFIICLFASMYSGESAISIGGINDNLILIDDENRKSGGGDFKGAKIGYLYSLDKGDSPSLWLDAGVAYAQNQGVIKYDDVILSGKPSYLSFKLGIVKRFYLGVPYLYFATKGEVSLNTLLAKRNISNENIMATRINAGIFGQLGLHLAKNHEMVLEAGYSAGMATSVTQGNKRVSDLSSSSSGASVYLGYIYHFNDDEDFAYEEEANQENIPYKIFREDAEVEPEVEVEPKPEVEPEVEPEPEPEVEEKFEVVKEPEVEDSISDKEDNIIFEDNLPMAYLDKNEFIDISLKKCSNDGKVCDKIKFHYWNKKVIFYFKFKAKNDKKINLSQNLKRIQIVNKPKDKHPTWLIVEAKRNIQNIEKLDSYDNNKEIIYRIYLNSEQKPIIETEKEPDPKPEKNISDKEENILFEDNLPMAYLDKNEFIDISLKKCSNDGKVCDKIKFHYWNKRVIFYFKFKTKNDKKVNLSQNLKRIQIANKPKNKYPTWLIIEAKRKIQSIEKLDSGDKEIAYRVYLE